MKSLIFSLALILGWVPTALAAGPGALTTLRAVSDLPKNEASKGLPVAFEGTVTFYHPVFRYLFVQDNDRAIFVFAPAGSNFASGDRVLVKGVTHAEFRPDVLADSITVLRHGQVPKAQPVTFDRLMSGEFDCLLVTVRGRVRAANLVLRPDVRSPISFKTHLAYLELLADGGYIDVILNSVDEEPLKDLLDADIEVTGVQNGKYDGKWHQTGSMIRAWSFANVKVLKRANASPWSLPITPIDKVLTGYHVEDSTKRVRVNGTITYYQPGYFRPGSALVLQNGTDTLWVETLTSKPLRIGDLADATGIPGVVAGSPALNHAEVQDSEEYLPVAPLNLTWQQLAAADMAGQHHYDLVSIEGKIVMQARGTAQDEYVLAHEGQLLSAIFHHPDSSSQMELPPMKEVPLGSTVRVTGICILQDTTLFSGKVPFNILLRSFDDIAVVARPSLLNIRNLIIAVSVLLLAMVTVTGWVWTLRRKVKRQTAALTERVEAEAALERRMAQLEKRRSRILEDISGSAPLAGILEQVNELVSFHLDGAPCWCEVTDGARLGHPPAESEKLRIVRAEIPARSGPALGQIFAGFLPAMPPDEQETEALSMGSKLASLAIETRRLYADLVHRSEFDLLTDILNRFSLEKNLEAQIDEARINATIFGLIYIDLDDFKQVNDQYGHNVGDLYLQEVASRMKRQLRSHDMLARLGGDEFAVMVPVVRSRAEVEEIALRLERSFDEPYAVEGYVLRGSASVGVALYPEDATTRDSLLSAADAAMYVAKHTRHAGQEGQG
jgi:diguanylate cyclase (GGDEF)-like protein